MFRAPLLLRALTLTLVLLGLSGKARADLLVSGQDTNTIFRFDENTGAFIEKLIGPGAGLSNPVGMRIGPDGALYIGNQGNGSVSRYDLTNGNLSTFATNPDTNVPFAPADVQFTPDGDMLVSNFYGNSIYRFDGTTGAYLSQYTAGGSLAQPTFMYFAPDDKLWVSSLGTNEVLEYDMTTFSGVPTAVFSRAVVAAGASGLSFPAGLLLGTDDNLYVSSLLGQQILSFDPVTGSAAGAVPFLSTPAFSFPTDLAYAPDGSGDLLIATAGSQGVLRYDGTDITTFAYHPDLLIAGQILIANVPELPSGLLLAIPAGASLVIYLRRRQ